MIKLRYAFSLLLVTALGCGALGCGDGDTNPFPTSSGSGTTGSSMGAVPTVAETTPVDTATGVQTSTKLTASFTAPMDPATITDVTFTLTQGGAAVLGAVTYVDGDAIFTPAAPLAGGTEFTATITTGAKSLAGRPLAKDHVWTFFTAQAPLDLGVASSYAILAFDTVTNVNSPGTVVTGDLGISPGTGAVLVGFPPGKMVGVAHIGDSAGSLAKAASLAAYKEAIARPGAKDLPGELGGMSFTPGLYKSAAPLTLSTGTLTLDAKGVEGAIFVFQTGSTLTTGTDTKVVLTGGAKAANVYWTCGTTATLGATSQFAGSILATTSVTLKTGASVEGRLLAQESFVALDASVVTVPVP